MATPGREQVPGSWATTRDAGFAEAHHVLLIMAMAYDTGRVPGHISARALAVAAGYPAPGSPADRRAASRAMSIRELTPSFRRMWVTWGPPIRRVRRSLGTISGLDKTSPTNPATY